MIGILCEKPSAAANFARALGAKRSGSGYAGTYNGESYKIAASVGHVYEFHKPEQQVPPALKDRYHSWDLANLPWDETQFKWTRCIKSGKTDVVKSIKAQFAGCDEICIATDNDPTGEGELIAWEILHEAKIPYRKCTRMYFADEAATSIQQAFVTRKTLPTMVKDPDYVKAQFRCQWDFLSMQFTRVATKCGSGGKLRQGRLKSAMVSIVGDQIARVDAYQKIPYYQIRFKDDKGNVFTNPDEPTFPVKTAVPKAYGVAHVMVTDCVLKSSCPPKLMDLAALSSILSSKGYKAKTILSVYQKMYEHQIVSYPRTEDKFVTPEQFDQLLPLVDKIAGVVGVDPALLTHRMPRKTHVKIGGAHGANRPCTNVPNSLSDLSVYDGSATGCAAAIYSLLAHNYLAMLAADYEYEQQRAELREYPAFKATINVPKSMGFKLVFSDEEPDAHESKGFGVIADPFVYEGFPTKPAQPTMKWLMKQLEKHDVGTGATRTSIYADITTTKKEDCPLLSEKWGKITMTDYGRESYVLLKGTLIGDVKMTEQLMQQMRDVAAGKVYPDYCLRQIRDYVRHDMKVMMANSKLITNSIGGITMEKKEKAEGLWNGKKIQFNRVWGGHRFTDDEVIRLLNGEEISVDGLISAKTGNSYSVTGKLTNQTYNGHAYVGFERTFDAIPTEWCKHIFTADEILMLKAGKPVELCGCISKKGNAFDCTVTWGKNDKGRMAIIPDFG